eukprot:scaffold78641_cov74-Phaeocystis_antarctica.AAC.4
MPRSLGARAARMWPGVPGRCPDQCNAAGSGPAGARARRLRAGGMRAHPPHPTAPVQPPPPRPRRPVGPPDSRARSCQATGAVDPWWSVRAGAGCAESTAVGTDAFRRPLQRGDGHRCRTVQRTALRSYSWPPLRWMRISLAGTPHLGRAVHLPRLLGSCRRSLRVAGYIVCAAARRSMARQHSGSQARAGAATRTARTTHTRRPARSKRRKRSVRTAGTAIGRRPGHVCP